MDAVLGIGPVSDTQLIGPDEIEIRQRITGQRCPAEKSAVAEDVEHMAVGVADEESPYAPWLVGQGMDYLGT